MYSLLEWASHSAGFVAGFSPISLRTIEQGPPSGDWRWRITFNERSARGYELRSKLFGALDEDPGREVSSGKDGPLWPAGVWVRRDVAPVTALEDQIMTAVLGKGDGKGKGKGKNPPRPPGKGAVCYQYQKTGKCTRPNCPYEHTRSGRSRAPRSS